MTVTVYKGIGGVIDKIVVSYVEEASWLDIEYGDPRESHEAINVETVFLFDRLGPTNDVLRPTEIYEEDWIVAGRKNHGYNIDR